MRAILFRFGFGAGDMGLVDVYNRMMSAVPLISLSSIALNGTAIVMDRRVLPLGARLVTLLI